MKRILGYLIRKIAIVIPVLAGVILLLFILLHLAPGNVVDVIGAENGISDPHMLVQMKAELGLNLPWYQQLGHYYWRVLHLDLGYSVRDASPVLDMIIERLPATLILMITGLTIAVITGVILGLIAASRIHTYVDTMISIFTMIFYAVPSFLVGMLAILIFSVRLGWLPVSGIETIGSDYEGWRRISDIAQHLIMPALALGMLYTAIYAKVMRASVIEVNTADFIQTAKAKGRSPTGILIYHVFRNAILPIVTLSGIQFGTLLAGSVVMESVFNWPGLGSLLFDAVQARNMPVVVGVMLMSSIVVVFANLIVDVINSWIDPRIA